MYARFLIRGRYRFNSLETLEKHYGRFAGAVLRSINAACRYSGRARAALMPRPATAAKNSDTSTS
jgi:hypothetical protein